MAIILLLFIILVLLLSIPSIQTYLGKKVTTRINDDFGTNINIGKIGLQFNGDVEIKEILIRDYKKDTLFAARELNTSILNFKNIINVKLVFGDIDLDGLIFNLKTYEGETDTNLDIFVAKFDEDNPSQEKSGFLLSSSDVTIYDGIFRLINENNETPKILEFSNIQANTTNLLINGSDVSTRINTLAFNDSRGLVVKNLVSNFTYTPSNILLEKLSITTANSSLEGDVKFFYNREELQDFTNKVQVDAIFTKSDVALNELNTFYNEFGVNQRAKLSAKISGTLNDLLINNLELFTSTRSEIVGNINFKNLFNREDNNFYMKGNFDQLSSNYRDLKALLPNVLGASIPTAFDKLGNFNVIGVTEITTSAVKADVVINTQIGLIDANLDMQKINDIDNASYFGNVVFKEFNVGKFINDETFGVTSLNLDVDGSGFTKENVNTKLNGDIFSMVYNNYTYENIDISGNLMNKIFNGKLISNDKNLQLEFNGLANFSEDINTFDFVANVSYANLNALNFVTKDDISIFKGIVDMKMEGTTINDAVGRIQFNKTSYKNQNDDYFFDDFEITSQFNEQVRYISVNSPDIIEGELSGDFVFEDIGKLFENAIGSIYTNFKPHKVKQNQYIDFNFKIYNKIVEVFVPDLKLGKNTHVRGRVESDEKEFKLTFKSPEIKLFDYFANQIELQLDNKNPVFNAYVEIDSINTKYYDVSKFNLINITLNDTLFVRSEFKGGPKNTDLYNLNFYHTINEENNSVVGFKKSDVTFKGNTWVINEQRNHFNKVVFDNKFSNVNIEQMVMSHNQEEISLSGVLKDSTYKNLHLNFKDVDLVKITPSIEGLELLGNVNGKLDVLQQKGNYLPSSKITIDNFVVNDLALGSFDAAITGNEDLSNYNVNIKIKDDVSQSFAAVGDISLKDEVSTIDVNLLFNEFKLSFINSFLEDILSDIRGDVSGVAKVSGNLNEPNISGDLELNNGGLRIPYLNVDYNFADNSNVSLTNQSFNFNALKLTDTKFDTKGLLNGSLSHTNFSKWKLNLDVTTDNLVVLDTHAEDDEEALYYGTAFIGGSAKINGPADQLVISVIATTNPGTTFVIPLSDMESFGDNSYIHFLTPEEKEAKLKGEDYVVNEVKGLELDFDLDITQDAEIEIVIDKDSGSTIRGKGEGGLLIEINTNGKFRMFGDFIVFEGIYNFKYEGIIEKRFKVQEGSIGWDGDPMGAIIDITAIYETQANPSPLLDNPINRSIPVNVEIQLTGQLEKPDPEFDFTFPNLSSTVKSEIQYRLSSKEDRDNQALYLLATGAFSNRLNDVNITGTLTERLNGIINGLITSGNNKVNIGLNYEAGENTPEYQTDDRLGVTLQTNISERVIINGKVGVPVGGVSETVVAGDVQIDFLLNEEGTLTAKVFNRENSIRNFGEEIGYTQGIGIAYSVDFDTFKELLDKIFKGKVKTIDTSKKEATKDKEDMLPSYVGFKKETSD
ncbi:translocation/assembly module TamB domain-containing protein [Xanthomarina sp. F2636L]|uniref:translocation/assembly module TamB domain-containing protein n=1 Tax=Xanthomarina sp. F2636L TaxID=2996018 RepID=UPI00225E5E9A|nr:translocation/assembly module TamB domain-containing protein [Xanthomarina sp. F2636L]MCX7549463.1 translocation/assembly module TamB [Xanthomarina sp. F2636L]